MTHEKRDRNVKFSRRKNFFKHRQISIKYLNIKENNIFLVNRRSFLKKLIASTLSFLRKF